MPYMIAYTITSSVLVKAVVSDGEQLNDNGDDTDGLFDDFIIQSSIHHIKYYC
jgi:hypothetical protein